MMLKPDKYFKGYEYYFPVKNRQVARKLFRRAIREYYAMQRKYVIEPETGRRVEEIFVGEVIQQQKRQRRRVIRVFKGRKIGERRPQRPEIKLLISRLFILWGRYTMHPATLSWKTHSSVQTHFEEFLNRLLPALGAPDVRRYVETHWRERK